MAVPPVGKTEAVTLRELTPARISAVDTVWREVLRIDDYTSTPRFLADLFTTDELNRALQKGHKSLTGMFEECRDRFSLDTPNELVAASADLSAIRPFVSDRLWSLFFVIRAIYGRLGILTAQSVDRKQYLDWRQDRLMNELLEQVLPEDIISHSKERTLSPFGRIICPNLEALFLEEARRVLDGNVSGAPIENLPETRVKGF